ncbi:hypothetical protein [Aliiruegeria lutimaris]|uniref:Uncharacterized protein n=1 Tax=Aliiruegeria lutimaris TaxID=571298 RepID=A0A1G8JTG4_9RHOB|nr:hypothetical protein [Aliiruegeria lutimaris]SDI34502.1 hypothetical protein SAMN04488026_100259 [Aliiruegeria lutimaris]
MSDPVSNADIEDVLSSIRRLVAGDKPDETGAADATQAEAPKDAAPHQPPVQGEEALVLTPSLRVEETEEQDAPSVLQDPETDRWEEDGEMDREPSASDAPDPETARGLESEPAEELAFSAVSPKEPVDAEDAALELPTFIRPLTTPADSEVPPKRVAAESDLADSEHLEEQISDDETLQARPAPRAGFMFSPLRKQENDSPFDDEVDEPQAPFLDASDAVEAGEIEEPAAVAEADRPPASEPEAETDMTAAPRESHLHLTVGSAEEVGVLDPWSADLDDAVSARSEEYEESQLEAPDNLFASGTVALDEEALREMVSEMLHKELRGALGERITRNVRKLVRREIHRALASRDFD